MTLKKFRTGILVGEKMIFKMQSLGIKVHYKKLKKEEYIKALQNKILEEAQELASKTAKDKIIAEMADILEVLDCFKDAYNINDEELIRVKNEKRDKKGSYTSRLQTQFLEIEENNPEIEYYLSRPEKYPEMD